MANQQASSGGIGFAGLLTILFIGLKLTGYITWSWWWVLAPTWIPVSIALVIIIVFIILQNSGWEIT
jgi:uncharacterized protein (DUF983 family)